MNKKPCESFFCTNRVPAKYRYCYECAKKKGLFGSGSTWAWWALFFVLVIVLFE